MVFKINVDFMVFFFINLRFFCTVLLERRDFYIKITRQVIRGIYFWVNVYMVMVKRVCWVIYLSDFSKYLTQWKATPFSLVLFVLFSSEVFMWTIRVVIWRFIMYVVYVQVRIHTRISCIVCVCIYVFYCCLKFFLWA